jgi:hypothetical protein
MYVLCEWIRSKYLQDSVCVCVHDKDVCSLALLCGYACTWVTCMFAVIAAQQYVYICMSVHEYGVCLHWLLQGEASICLFMHLERGACSLWFPRSKSCHILCSSSCIYERACMHVSPRVSVLICTKYMLCMCVWPRPCMPMLMSLTPLIRAYSWTHIQTNTLTHINCLAAMTVSSLIHGLSAHIETHTHTHINVSQRWQSSLIHGHTHKHTHTHTHTHTESPSDDWAA